MTSLVHHHMKELKVNELLEVNGGKGFWKGYIAGKVVDYIIDGTLNPSQRSLELNKRVYGSKWKLGDRYNK